MKMTKSILDICVEKTVKKRKLYAVFVKIEHLDTTLVDQSIGSFLRHLVIVQFLSINLISSVSCQPVTG